jgi:ABC-type lipoprotein release transport system permease subunit
VPTISADDKFAATFGLMLAEGAFHRNLPGTATESEIVLNESAVKALGLNAPVGATVTMPNGFNFKVAGVVKDFNLSSFKDAIGPLAFIPTKLTRSYRYLTLKLNGADLSKEVEEVKRKWQELSPSSPFEYSFMDDNYKALYSSELKLRNAAQLATLLNLVIVFMGIFGIVAFTLARRSREIAIRKVLGADVPNIVRLFLNDYSRLLLLSNIIAWPLAYLCTYKWLLNYSYRVEQNFLPYITVGAVITFTTFLFVTAQCLSTALSNPVKNLRSE